MTAKIRIRYVKSYALRYLSHLEIARCLERACRRAGLPIALSEGFNPHFKLVFATTLPVGVTSCTEYLDMTLSRHMDPEEAAGSLSKYLPDGLSITGSAVVVPGTPALQSLDAHYGFMITGAGGEELFSAASKLKTLGELPVRRKKADAIFQEPGRFIREIELIPAGSLSPGCSCGMHASPADSSVWIKIFSPGLGGGLKIGDILTYLAAETSAAMPLVAQRTMLGMVRDDAELSPI